MTAHFGKTSAAVSPRAVFGPPGGAPAGTGVPHAGGAGSRLPSTPALQHFVLACCPVGPLVFGIEAAHVGSIGDQATADDSPEGPSAPINLAQEFRVALADETAIRRVLTLQVGERSVRLLVGPEVAVRELTGRLLPLPPFVAGLGSKAAISGLIALPQRYLFVLDVARLVENALARRASEVRP